MRELHAALERLPRVAAPARAAAGGAQLDERAGELEPRDARVERGHRRLERGEVDGVGHERRPPQRDAEHLAAAPGAGGDELLRREPPAVVALAARGEQPGGRRAPRRHGPLQAPASQAPAELEESGNRLLVPVLGLGDPRPGEEPDVVEHALGDGLRRIAGRQQRGGLLDPAASTRTMASSAPMVRS